MPSIYKIITLQSELQNYITKNEEFFLHLTITVHILENSKVEQLNEDVYGRSGRNHSQGVYSYFRRRSRRKPRAKEDTKSLLY